MGVELRAGLALAALILLLDRELILGRLWLGMDTATAFYPWYSFLGAQLRAGQIPSWNPYQFAGTPFAGDPESGWMYLPAMAFFSLLPLEAAARTHMLFHLVFAGLSTYALARSLGASVAGSMLAGVAYAQSGFLQGHSVCCFAYSSVATWLPLLLLGAERALRAGAWQRRALWWGVSGLAFSQILAAWIGQGAYYAALLLGGFLTWRALVGQQDGAGGLAARGKTLALNGVGIGLFGVALGAAGLLPRLEYNLLSNLPGGYPDARAILATPTLTEWGIIDDWQRRLLQPGFSYPGVTTLALAAVAVLTSARRNSAVPFFAALTLIVLLLARYQPTPLHALFDLLPGFERIHTRSPERALLVFYLGPAILAGLALTALERWLPRRPLAHAALAALALTAVTTDLHLGWQAQVAESNHGGGDYQFTTADLADYYAPTAATRYLQAQQANGHFRAFGYAEHYLGEPVPYTLRWTDRRISSLEVNNRGLLTGIQDIQGYNPLHLARYDAFFSALNGRDQNYHHADVLPSGLGSPLLDVLNVRFAIVPVQTARDERQALLDERFHQVYVDETVRILENPSALPRAWLVHAAEQVEPGEAARLLASRSVDARRVALLEAPAPALSQPPGDARTDEVEVIVYGPDRIELRTASTAAGLLVLSEVYYPAWRSAVDGQAVETYLVDGALRGIQVPAGAHAVTTWFESTALNVGLAVSLLAYGALLALLVVALRRAGPGRRQQ